MAKKHAALYLDEDIWNRAKAACARTAGFVSVSGLVNAYLAQFVPFMEQALDQAEVGDRRAMVAFLDGFVSSNVGTLGSELADVRRELLKEPGEEETS